MQQSNVVNDRGSFTRTKTREGFLRAKAAITRAGIIEYDASELGVGPPGKTIKVMRPESVIHHTDTITTARGAALTLGHPSAGVSPENWGDESVGNMVGEPHAQNQRLHTDILVGKQEAIDAIEKNNLQELSIGYTFRFVEAGDDDPFDYKVVDGLDINHVAIVKKGRAGKDVRVFDSRNIDDDRPEEDSKMNADDARAFAKAVIDEMAKINKVDVDFDSIESKIMKKLQPTIDSMNEVAAAATKAADEAKAAEATALAKTKADELVAAVRTEERQRAGVLADALPLIDESKRDALADASIDDILRTAIGDENLPKEADTNYLLGAFSVMKKQRDTAAYHTNGAPTKPTGTTGGTDAVTEARNSMVASLANAWQAQPPTNATAGGA